MNAFIELTMSSRPPDAKWTLGLSELVAYHIDKGNKLSTMSFVDAFRATMDGTNPMYPWWDKIQQVFFPMNVDNEHWVDASFDLENYELVVYDSLMSTTNGLRIMELMATWKPFIKKDLENMG